MQLCILVFNQFVQYHHFKMVCACSDLTKLLHGLDLKDAYYPMPVAENDSKYLRFLLAEDLYQYTCLPNGLASVPRVPTKLLKSALSDLRRHGYICVAYIDDLYLQAHTYGGCQNTVQQVIQLFT